MKSLTLILVTVFFSSYIYAESIVIEERVQAYKYNSIFKRQLKANLAISTDSDELTSGRLKNLTFIFKDGLGNVVFYLDEKNREKFRGYLTKYKAWNKKADKKGVTLQKDIGNFEASKSAFSIGKNWYAQRSPLKITATFFSLKKGKHQMVLKFSKITSDNNEFSTHDPDELYFNWSDASKLSEILKEKSLIKVANRKLKKKRSIANEFK